MERERPEKRPHQAVLPRHQVLPLLVVAWSP
jgi:hypothetical protein